MYKFSKLKSIRVGMRVIISDTVSSKIMIVKTV